MNCAASLESTGTQTYPAAVSRALVLVLPTGVTVRLQISEADYNRLRAAGVPERRGGETA
jgi:hypothetical protein